MDADGVWCYNYNNYLVLVHDCLYYYSVGLWELQWTVIQVCYFFFYFSPPFPSSHLKINVTFQADPREVLQVLAP